MYLIAHLLMGDLQCQNQDTIFNLHGKSVSFFDLQGFYRVKPVSLSNISNKVGDCLAWLKPPLPRKKWLSWLNGGNRPACFWNFHWFLSIPGSYFKPMVKSWGLLVLKREIFTKSIPALSNLCFERLPAMCWTLLKISGNPVFKTPGRYKLISFSSVIT